MSRRAVENTKGATNDVDTVPEVQGGWRKPNTGEMGIHTRGICGVHRKTFVILTLFLAYFFFQKLKKFTTKLRMLDSYHWAIVH